MTVAATLDVLGFVEGEPFEVFTRTAKGIRARRFSEVSKGEAFARAYPSDCYATSGPIKAGATPPRGRCRAEDLAAVRALLVDVDPAKNDEDPEGVSPAHRAAARALAFRVRDEVLAGLGVRAVVLSSGRGTTLVVRHADLSPTDRKTKALRRSILAALARGFTDPLAGVDEAVAVVNVGLRVRGSVNSKTNETVAQVEAGEGVASIEQLEGWLASLEARWPSPRPARVVAPAPLPGEVREWRASYVTSALEKILAEFTSTGEGGRNAALNRAAFAVGQFEAGGAPINGAVQRLADLALDAGMGELEVRKTLESGLESGRKNPRTPPADRPRAVRLPGSEGNNLSEFADESIHLTDLGNARRLVRRHGSDLRRCPGLGWLTWDGRRWLRDETGEVQRRAHDVPREIYVEAAELEAEALRETDPDAAKKKRAISDALRKHAAHSESEPSLRRMATLAESLPGIPVLVERLDSDPLSFNCASGVIDLKTGRLRPHERRDLSTKVSPVPFDPEARSPLWEKFLDRVTGSSAELVGFLQKVCGYSLSGLTTEQCFFLLHGSGANGKSTFVEVLRAVLGDYATGCQFSTFLARDANGPRSDIARLRGARLVSAIETKDAGRLDEGLVKQLTGGDAVVAAFKYENEFEFVPQFKLVLAANEKPSIRGSDDGIWRRVRLVPFEVKIPPEERDPDLKEKLLGELPGVLAWCVRGALAWQAEGLGVPAEVQAATDAYKHDENDLAPFLEEVCRVTPEATSRSRDLFVAYRTWATDRGDRPMSEKRFSTKLGDQGFTKNKTKSGAVWLGIGLLASGDGLRGHNPSLSGNPLVRAHTQEVSLETRQGDGSTRHPSPVVAWTQGVMNGFTSDPDEFDHDH